MARIRTVKPEFWGDEKLAPLPALARLVFLGLISMADDAGRLLDNVKSIDGFIFPESDETSRDSLDTLARTSRIVRYTSESGQKLIQIANWLKHQKVDKPSKYVLPGPGEPSRDSSENLASLSRSDLGPTTNDLVPPTDDQGPTTAAARDRQVLGVTGQPLLDARNELAKHLGQRSEGIIDDFLADAPEASRFAWARGLVAMVDPPGTGAPVPADVLLVAMQDFLVADRERWPFVGRVFRAFIDDAKRSESPAGRPSAEPRRRTSRDGRAALLVGEIRGLIDQRQQPGQAAIRFIPKAKVQELGPDVFAAYEAVGGADRFISATGENVSFLIRDFSQTLEASHG